MVYLFEERKKVRKKERKKTQQWVTPIHQNWNGVAFDWNGMAFCHWSVCIGRCLLLLLSFEYTLKELKWEVLSL